MSTWLCIVPVILVLAALLIAILRISWRSSHCDYCHQQKSVVKPIPAGWKGEGTRICSDCYYEKR